MRSAGCIFNDIVDKDFDKKVNRTKNRPIPTGMISVKRALVYVFILCLVAFFVLMQFNPLTIILGISSMLLAFSYPFMKRITYWPQLFLGITFNWGILMAWTAVTNNISHDIIILYLSAIFWTLGYDTIYGAQDMSDDEIIGLKSTSIKFKKNIKMFVSIAYILTIILMSYLFTSTIGINISSLFFLLFIVILIYQVKRLNKNDPKICLRLFKINNLAGLIMFLSIFSGNL
jgi:4-hydroxybenzoate polyprenyl transferase